MKPVKTCTKCKVEKSASEFHRRKNYNKSGHGTYYPGGSSQCKECLQNAGSTWRYNNIDYNQRRNKTYRLRNRLAVLSHYGGNCACCAESRYEFLALDHIDGKGTEHRASLGNQGRGQNFYWWIVRNNFPAGYRILCHNCNLSLGLYGYCPHNQESAFMLDKVPLRGRRQAEPRK